MEYCEIFSSLSLFIILVILVNDLYRNRKRDKEAKAVFEYHSITVAEDKECHLLSSGSTIPSRPILRVTKKEIPASAEHPDITADGIKAKSIKYYYNVIS